MDYYRRRDERFESLLAAWLKSLPEAGWVGTVADLESELVVIDDAQAAAAAAEWNRVAKRDHDRRERAAQAAYAAAQKAWEASAGLRHADRVEAVRKAGAGLSNWALPPGSPPPKAVPFKPREAGGYAWDIPAGSGMTKALKRAAALLAASGWSVSWRHTAAKRLVTFTRVRARAAR